MKNTVFESRRNLRKVLFSLIIFSMFSLNLVSVSSLGADINGNGVVNIDDLVILLNSWGDCPLDGDCPSDLNYDGLIGEEDRDVLLALFYTDGIFNFSDTDVDGNGVVNIDDLVEVLINFGTCEENSTCSGDIYLDSVIDEIDLNIVLVSIGIDFGGDVDFGFLAEINSSEEDSNSGVINIDDLIALLNSWGDCPIDGDCLYDFNLDEKVGNVDLEILISLFGVSLDDFNTFSISSADVNGNGVVNVDDLVDVLNAFGPCNANSSCPEDVFEDGVVDSIDLDLVKALFGTEFFSSFLEVDLVEPFGDYHSLTEIPISFSFNSSSGEIDCSYSVKNASSDLVINQTVIENCTTNAISSFEVFEGGSYTFFLVVNDGEGNSVSKNSNFTAEETTAVNNNGGSSDSSGSSSSSGRRSSGGGGCFAEWICTDWGECLNGTQTRTCEKDREFCYAGEVAELERECDSEIVEIIDEEENSGFFSRLTGAVIGPGGKPTTFGILVFVVLIAFIYFVSSNMRKKVEGDNDVDSKIEDTKEDKNLEGDKEEKKPIKKEENTKELKKRNTKEIKKEANN